MKRSSTRCTLPLPVLTGLLSSSRVMLTFSFHHPSYPFTSSSRACSLDGFLKMDFN
ncbi:hypothetical protein Hanom_Chr15g01367251 [Helianthus anomalus]